MSKKDDMSIVSLLARSKKRLNVLKSLEKEDKIPSKSFSFVKSTAHTLAIEITAINTIKKVNIFLFI
jgi:hypothetical protein